LWTRHGVHFPVALPGSPITLKQAWISSRIALLSPEARLALPNLQKPLDISSDAVLQNFSATVEKMNVSLGQMHRGIENCYGPNVSRSLSQAKKHADSVGLKIPDLPVKEIRSLFSETLSMYMDFAQSYIIEGDVSMVRANLRLAMIWSKELNIELPLLSLENVSPEAKTAYSEILKELKSEA
jgi:hypothetical protein